MGNLVSLRPEFRTYISLGSLQVPRCYLQTKLFIRYFLFSSLYCGVYWNFADKGQSQLPNVEHAASQCVIININF